MNRRRGRVRALNPRLLTAAREVSKLLTKRGHAHALIGGLAVNQLGYERATSVVDFLVTGDAERDLVGDALGGEVRGKTIDRGGTVVNLLFPREHERFLEREIARARGGVVAAEALVYLKLAAGRMKDIADVVELLKRGKLDVKITRGFLKRHARSLVEDFDALVEQARLEAD